MAFLLVALGRLILLFQSGTVNIWTSVTESVKSPQRRKAVDALRSRQLAKTPGTQSAPELGYVRSSLNLRAAF